MINNHRCIKISAFQIKRAQEFLRRRDAKLW